MGSFNRTLGEEESMANEVYGMHHIGITVPDIEEGIAFFKAVFGAIEVFRTGPFDVDQDFMKNKLGASPLPGDTRTCAFSVGN